jgi:hypothetical protein
MNMIIVDINNEKNLKYQISNISAVKSIEMIVELPNNVELKFPGVIDIPNDLVHVTLPILKKEIPDKILVNCYLEAEDMDGKFYRLSEDEILFQSSPVIQLKFHEAKPDLKISLNEQNEITLDTLPAKEKEVHYETAKKPPRRTEIFVEE